MRRCEFLWGPLDGLFLNLEDSKYKVAYFSYLYYRIDLNTFAFAGYDETLPKTSIQKRSGTGNEETTSD